MNAWAHSVWIGSRYEQRGRTVRMDKPGLIFRCPLCEYRMTARTDSEIRTVRRFHVYTAHPEAGEEVAALDGVAWTPQHLRKDPVP